MTYDSGSPPVCITGPLTRGSNQPQIWYYASTDAAATVDADGYIDNGDDLGMQVGDIVFVIDTDASPVIITVHRVTSVTAGGAADLSDGDTLVTGTDSD